MPERQGQGRAGRKTRAGAELTLNLDSVHSYRDRVWGVRDLTGARATDQPVESNSAPQVASRSETLGRQAASSVRLCTARDISALSALGPAPLTRRPARDRHLRNLRDREAGSARPFFILFVSTLK